MVRIHHNCIQVKKMEEIDGVLRIHSIKRGAIEYRDERVKITGYCTFLLYKYPGNQQFFTQTLRDTSIESYIFLSIIG